MKLEKLKGIDTRLRTFLLMAVGFSYPAWDVGIELGVYGEKALALRLSHRGRPTVS